jgi:hypothetical protein
MNFPSKPASSDLPDPKTATAPKAVPPGKIALHPYSTLCGAKGSAGPHVTLLEVQLKRLITSVLGRVRVDEAWYVKRYPDVREAMARGNIPSAKYHYRRSGYFEDRIPHRIRVDRDWYLDKYPDVEKAISAGRFSSAQEHFERDGFREGRLPYPNWTLCD